MNLDQKSKRKNVPYLPKKHEAVFFTKNEKKMIMKNEKNTIPPVKNVQFWGVQYHWRADAKGPNLDALRKLNTARDRY